MKIQINVTKEILERSKSCNGKSTGCAVALAIIELFPKAVVLLKGSYLVAPAFLDQFSYVLFPLSAQFFIAEFDSHKDDESRAAMTPISFEIDVPDYVINKIGIGTIYKVLSESKTLQHVNT